MSLKPLQKSSLLEEKMEQVKFEIPTISCGHCVNSIQMEIGDMPGVTGVWADQDTKSVEIEFDPPASVEKIKETLKNINYPVKE